MAVRLNATGDTLDLTTALPSNTSFTIMLDAQIVSDLGSTIQPLVFALDGGFTDGFSLIWEGPADTMMIEAYDAGAVSSNTAFGSRPAVGVPFCAFVRCRGTGAGLYEAGWKYPLGPWVRANATMAGTIAQVATIWFGGVLGTYTADKRTKNIKIWDRALSDGELLRESESESVVFKSGLNCHFPMPHLGDLRDRGPKSKTIARGGTLETELFSFPRYSAGRNLIPATAPAAGGTFQILAGPRFSLAGAHGLAGD